jgi:hypothetical protein
MKNKVIGPGHYNNLLDRIANILVEARTKVFREINKAQVLAYWEIGREIIEFEQKGKIRAEYGQRLLIRLSEDLVQKFGRGFSVDNLQLMRRFYITFQGRGIYETVSRKFTIRQTVSAKFEPMLSWSHYCELLKIEEPLAHYFYEHSFRSHIHGVVIKGASSSLVC